jgi:hypothetical protein
MAKKSQQNIRSLDVDEDAVRTLRPLREEEAFHFYAAVGEPTGEKAGSLADFLERVRSVKLESLAFHHQRKDFQNWVETTLGDSKLARKMGRIRPSCDDSLRQKMCTVVEGRIKELTETSMTIYVSEGLAVTPPNATV